ncbi:MAG: D-alanyl-D-alanine carboxypeptidase [Patescibacteria group bacterium]|nr:D-alanyl-D-alanine carboxypeptidase [Patescibacteria group bacterium]
MPSNQQKLLFLAIIIALALFSRFAYPTFFGSRQPITDNPATDGRSVPYFAMQSVEASTSTAAEPSATPVAVRPRALMGTANFTATGDASPPVIADHETLIADLDSGSIIYGSHIDERWPLASVTKLMTASIVLDHFTLNQPITVTPAAVAADPTATLLQAGDVYTVSDLLHALLLPSSNVAAEAFAGAYGREQFLALMNARAAAWGMVHTHYDDPSGLSPGNRTTAGDLLLLAQKIYADYPQILAITRTPQVTIKELNSGRLVPVKSINDFAGRPDFIGGKTGFTDEADGNLLSIFSYKNHPVLFVVLGTADNERFSETLKLLQWFEGNFK